jgi:regulator of cell morphogenesis and NO signaling
MNITPDTRISDIATGDPSTIKVFQHHQIDFCCGGKIPLAEACARHGIDPATLLAELHNAQPAPDDTRNWETRSLADLIAHIRARYHEPLRAELPRLAAMMAKVVQRHGDHRPEMLRLHATFEHLRVELLDHMAKEDAVLFPTIVSAERALANGGVPKRPWQWIEQPIAVMEAEHESAGAALAKMRELTDGYQPPEGACPTFRGLYHGLADFEREMHVHVHLENNVLFPRAAELARALTRRLANPGAPGAGSQPLACGCPRPTPS